MRFFPLVIAEMVCRLIGASQKSQEAKIKKCVVCSKVAACLFLCVVVNVEGGDEETKMSQSNSAIER